MLSKNRLSVALGATAVSLVSIGIWWSRRQRKSIVSLGCCSAQDKCCFDVSDECQDVDKEGEREDLENLLEHYHDDDHHRSEISTNGIVLPRVHRTSRIQEKEGIGDDGMDRPNQCIPGTQLVYVKTFGCSHNTSDSEVMMGLLQSFGYRFTSKLDDSDVCLINSCTVKNPSQEAFMSIVRKAQEAGKAVVVAGCVPQADRHLHCLENVSIIGTNQIERVVDVVEETLKGNCVRLLSKGSLPSLDIPKVRRNHLIEIIPISSGCLGVCTYCKTKKARGQLGSYSTTAILNRIKTSAMEGVQQIWLTSEDTGAYGIDLKTNIGELLKCCVKVLEDIERDTGKRIMLRLGMTNPPYMAAHIKTIVDLLKHRNVFRFIHIPVQSGSTKVLKDMVREYTINEFNFLVEELSTHVPNITIATDIICGFPTEQDHDHQETVDLIRNYRFQVVNISQFYPRPGTPAARMKRVPTQIVKQRSREVSEVFNSYYRNEFLNGSIQRVWFSESQPDKSQTVGHTIHFIKVLVPEDPSLLGTQRFVRILKTTKWHAEGELYENLIDFNFDSIYPD